ncbi:hypothetical protein B7463_g2429, partial [Scytalidium lignicola]
MPIRQRSLAPTRVPHHHRPRERSERKGAKARPCHLSHCRVEFLLHQPRALPDDGNELTPCCDIALNSRLRLEVKKAEVKAAKQHGEKVVWGKHVTAMSDDDSAGSSLLLAQHNDRAQREHHHDHDQHHNHNHNHNTHPHSHSHSHNTRHNHNHEHKLLQGREEDGIETSTPTVTVETIEVVQQITVDGEGHTLGIKTFEPVTLPPATATPPTIPTPQVPLTLIPASPSLATPPAVPSTLPFTTVGLIVSSSTLSSSAFSSGTFSSSASLANVDTSASQSLLSSSSHSTVLTSLPSTTSAIPTSFASFPVNSTSVSNKVTTTHSTSLPIAFLNSTTASTLPSSTFLSSSTSSFLSSSSDSASVFLTTEVQPAQPTASNAGGIFGGAGTQGATGPTSTSSSGSGNGSNSTSPSTPTVIGGVVGSIAGLAVILFFLLFILRWRKKGKAVLSLPSRNIDPGMATRITPGGGPSAPPMGMTERALPTALTAMPLYKRFSQKSDTNRTVSSAGTSERGFYKVSGRKLPSVLQSGGDGYGQDNIQEDGSLRESSFYRDSKGFYGGPGTPTFPGSNSSPLGQIGLQVQRESVMPVVRPGPARTPVTNEGPFADPPTPPRNLPLRPDVLGRSHPSQDGSHTSRFTEEV